MAENRYLNSTTKFAEKFPPGMAYAMTAVYKFLDELTTGKNGFDRDPALAPDMHIDNQDQRRASIIRKLNSAGSNANIRITDEKDGTIYVQTYNSYALGVASPTEQIKKLERLAKTTEKRAKVLGTLDGLSTDETEAAALRKESLEKLVHEANHAVQTSREFNFMATAKRLGIADETARKLLPHMDELTGNNSKKR